MHKYLRAIGLSQIKNRKQLFELIKDTVQDATQKEYAALDDDTMFAEFSKDYGENIGISVRGEFDEDNKFIYEYYFPYLRGMNISSVEDVSVERHAEKESYAGVCDDIKVGVSLIFYLQNVITYIKIKSAGILPIRGTTLTLSGLSCMGTIMMPIIKNEKQKKKIKKASKDRNNLIEAARHGNEDAIESLTLEDMDTYTVISKRIQNEDVFSLVDTYFMPYGVECDQYSVLGEILNYQVITNNYSNEKVVLMTLSCNDLTFDICINQKDLLGEVEVGRRFKGIVWMQGFINYPDSGFA